MINIDWGPLFYWQRIHFNPHSTYKAKSDMQPPDATNAISIHIVPIKLKWTKKALIIFGHFNPHSTYKAPFSKSAENLAKSIIAQCHKWSKTGIFAANLQCFFLFFQKTSKIP
jgi:hypothetical protein